MTSKLLLGTLSAAIAIVIIGDSLLGIFFYKDAIVENQSYKSALILHSVIPLIFFCSPYIAARIVNIIEAIKGRKTLYSNNFLLSQAVSLAWMFAGYLGLDSIPGAKQNLDATLYVLIVNFSLAVLSEFGMLAAKRCSRKRNRKLEDDSK